MDLSVKKQSGWKYVTSADIGQSVSKEVGKLTAGVAGDAGFFDLRDPFGAPKRFWFGGGGLGAGAAVPLPTEWFQGSEIGKKVAAFIEGYIRGSDGGGFSLPSFPGRGTIMLVNQCSKQELDVDDFQGACMWINVSFGVGVGVSCSVMIFGMSMILLGASSLGAPAAWSPLIIGEAMIVGKLLGTATGVMVFGGENVSNTVLAANLTGYVGAMV